jgi:cytochrome c-type protein NapB
MTGDGNRGKHLNARGLLVQDYLWSRWRPAAIAEESQGAGWPRPAIEGQKKGRSLAFKRESGEKKGVSVVTWKILACVIAAMFICMAAPAGAADPLQSLRGKAAVNESDPSSPIYPVREGLRNERSFLQQPPMIPHRVDKYEIDLKVNQCLRCHDWPNNAQENAPLVSVSHFYDREGTKLDKVAGQRWFCTQCHAPQVDAKPLVANRFQPAIEK